MKGLLSKEHYCDKIHTLLMKSIAYPHSMDNPPPLFLQENLDPPSMIFQKSQPFLGGFTL